MLHKEGRERTIVRASLFDRLVDEEPGQISEARPRSTYNVEQLLASIEAEISRILNSRRPVRSEEEAAKRTILDYGISDFVSMHTEDPDDHEELEQMIQEAIQVYEPRLRRVQVSIEGPALSHNSLLVRLNGELTVTPVPAAVSFKISLENPRPM